MINVRTFLIDKGLIQPHDVPSGSEFRITCPSCQNPKNKCFVNAQAKGVHCKHCGFSKGWLGFTRMYEPPSKQEETFEKFVADAALALGKDAALNQYLHDRGFTDATIWNHRLGVCPKRRATPEDIEFGLAYPGGKWVLADRLIIPYSQDGIVVTVRGRQLPGHETDKKYMSLPGTTTPPYIPERIDPEKPVLLCEGEFDALLASQFGFQAIGIPGAQHFEKDKDLIAHYPDKSIGVAYIGSKWTEYHYADALMNACERAIAA